MTSRSRKYVIISPERNEIARDFGRDLVVQYQEEGGVATLKI